jgi:hypothetical protein
MAAQLAIGPLGTAALRTVSQASKRGARIGSVTFLGFDYLSAAGVCGGWDSRLWRRRCGRFCWGRLHRAQLCALSYGALKSSRAEEMLKPNCCDLTAPHLHFQRQGSHLAL